MKQVLNDALAYVEWLDPESIGLWEAFLYVEYVGDSASAYTPNIPTVADVLLYVEYREAEQGPLVPEILAYVEYISDPYAGRVRSDDLLAYVEWVGPDCIGLWEAFLYVEYIGDSAFAYTTNIATVADTLLYVEYREAELGPAVPEVLAYVEFTYEGQWPPEEEGAILFVFGPLVWMV